MVSVALGTRSCQLTSPHPDLALHALLHVLSGRLATPDALRVVRGEAGQGDGGSREEGEG